MKKSLKFFSALFAMITIAAMSVTLTSCSDDDEPNGTILYAMGFGEFNVSGMDADFDLSDLTTIEDAFKSALGVNDNTFSMTGKAKECDEKVKQACDQAVKSLEGTAWKGRYVYVVTNVNTSSMVYSHTFGK